MIVLIMERVMQGPIIGIPMELELWPKLVGMMNYSPLEWNTEFSLQLIRYSVTIKNLNVLAVVIIIHPPFSCAA